MSILVNGGTSGIDSSSDEISNWGEEPKLIGEVDIISFNSIHFRYVNSMLAQMRFKTESRGPL
jgi:hypothetical protein